MKKIAKLNENSSLFNSQTFKSTSSVIKNKEETKKENKSKTDYLLNKIIKKNPEKYFVVKETEKTKKNYLKNILKNMMKENKKTWRKTNFSSDVHEIRIRLLDWITEVLSAFECKKNTFFLAVDIIDEYLIKTQNDFDLKNIQLLGVTSIFIASKFTELIPFRISTVVEKMTHNTLESSEILILEQKILSVFNFRIYKKMTLFETVELLFVKFNLHLTKYFDKLCNIVNYIAKIILFDFELMTQYSVKYLAASCFYISIKIVNQISPRLDPKKFVKKINIFLKLNENKFYICSKLLLELSKNFKNKFPFASNLEKYDAFNI